MRRGVFKLVKKVTRGNTMYQIDYGYICIVTTVRQILHFFTNVDLIYQSYKACVHL